MKKSLTVILLGLICVIWMFADAPSDDQASASDPAASPAITGDVSSASWSAKCDYSSQAASIDPIKDWGGMAPHLHVFSAPTIMDSMISPGTLIALPNPAGSECIGPTRLPTTPAGGCRYTPVSTTTSTVSVCDKSAYWVPALYSDADPTNSMVTPTLLTLDHMNIYWRNEYTHPQSDSPFPEDFSEVGGDAMAMTPQSFWIVNWQCVDDVAQAYPKTETPGPTSNVIPATQCEFPEDRVCPHGLDGHCDPVYLRMAVTMPECVKLTTNAAQGMVTPATASYAMTPFSPAPAGPTDGEGYHDCVFPGAGWSQIMPIQVDPHWLVNKGDNAGIITQSLVTESGVPYLHWDLSNLLLSSDLVMDQKPMSATVTPGTTGHADYENGYRAADIEGLVQTCFDFGTIGRNCGSI